MRSCAVKTDLIVSRFIREAEFLLDNNEKPYNNIPRPIVFVIKSFIENYFANNGKYKWQINDGEIIKEMLNARNGDKFESESFKMARLKWKLEIYPNGNNEDVIGYFVIHLRLLSLPLYIDQIQIIRIFRVIENMTGSCWNALLCHHEYEYWTKKCALIELQKLNPSSLTIDIFIEINKLYLKPNYYQYNIAKVIDSKEIKKMAKQFHLEYKMDILPSENFKSMCSEILYDRWCIEVYLNGSDKNDKRYLGVFARLTNLNNIESLEVQYTVKCMETGYQYDDKYDYPYPTLFTEENNSWGKDGVMEWEYALKYDTLTFVFDITILKINKLQSPNLLEICDESNITYLLTST